MTQAVGDATVPGPILTGRNSGGAPGEVGGDTSGDRSNCWRRVALLVVAAVIAVVIPYGRLPQIGFLYDENLYHLAASLYTLDNPGWALVQDYQGYGAGERGHCYPVLELLIGILTRVVGDNAWVHGVIVVVLHIINATLAGVLALIIFDSLPIGAGAVVLYAISDGHCRSLLNYHFYLAGGTAMALAALGLLLVLVRPTNCRWPAWAAAGLLGMALLVIAYPVGWAAAYVVAWWYGARGRSRVAVADIGIPLVVVGCALVLLRCVVQPLFVEAYGLPGQGFNLG